MFLAVLLGFLVLGLFLAIVVNYICHEDITLNKKLFIYYVWFISFMPIVIIPFEVDELYGSAEQRMSSDQREEFKLIWKFYYWNNFFNGWIFVPIFTGTLCSGYFEFRHRIIDAVVYNITFYSISVGIVALGAFITISQADITFTDFVINGLAIYNSM
jgi:hypothetical protein